MKTSVKVLPEEAVHIANEIYHILRFNFRAMEMKFVLGRYVWAIKSVAGVVGWTYKGRLAYATIMGPDSGLKTKTSQLAWSNRYRGLLDRDEGLPYRML